MTLQSRYLVIVTGLNNVGAVPCACSTGGNFKSGHVIHSLCSGHASTGAKRREKSL